MIVEFGLSWCRIVETDDGDLKVTKGIIGLENCAVFLVSMDEELSGARRLFLSHKIANAQ